MQTRNNFHSPAAARRARAGRALLAAVLPALFLMAAAPAVLAQGAMRAAGGAANVQTQGPAYRAVPGVAPDQAQVVFYRNPLGTTAVADGEAAHVYINGEFHTALQPHSFTRFCVTPGSYAIEAHIGDAPKFAAKADPRTRVALEGGKTYFAHVSENRSGDPVPTRRDEAEKQLEGASEQRHFVNRASVVVPCHEVQAVAAEKIRYTLSADVLFDFAKSDYGSITPLGREELRKVAEQIREHSPSTVTRVRVRGHADPIGSVPGNRVLSEQRARTVVRVLGEEGLASDRLSFEGVGSSEPVVSCASTGSKQARVACNAPNRRVEIIGEGVK